MNVGLYLPTAIPPTEHIQTTSGCGIWPMDGSLNSYFFKIVENFENDCFPMQLINSQTNEIEANITLNQNSVKKLMHLIMNPLANAISRFVVANK